jgi:hypothetical protein
MASDIDFQYLMKKYMKPVQPHNAPSFNAEEKKFYMHRILDLFKRLLINQPNTSLPNHLIDLFHAFLKESILFFQQKDRTDIIQAEMTSFLENDFDSKPEIPDLLPQNHETETVMTIDLPIPRKITFFEKNLVRLNKSKTNLMIFPKEKTINLQEPTLRKKDMLQSEIDDLKKENLDSIIYETIIEEEELSTSKAEKEDETPSIVSKSELQSCNELC